MELVTFTENLVKSLVKEPDLVKVQQFDSDEENTILEIIVCKNDMGAIIGRAGKMAQAIRTVVQAYTFNKGLKKVRVNIDSF